MIDWRVVGLLAGMLLVTYFTRYAMIGLLGKLHLSPDLRRWLEFVPVAVFTAIIVPSTLMPDGHIDLSFHNHYAWAALTGALVALISRHTLVTIVAAFATFMLLRWFGV